MPDENDENEGTIQAEVGRLPAPTRAPEDAGLSNTREVTTPALSDEELDERQRLLGTRRKPAGPGDDGTRAERFGDEEPSDVPETEVGNAAELDPENPDGRGGNDDDDDGGPEPLESSERE
jgi:hypothetical protein